VYPALHDSGAERDSCGIGFVADVRGRPSRAILDAALEGLRRVGHRGAVAADGLTGDGAGVLLPLAPGLVPGPWCGLAMVFLRDEAARHRVEAACVAEGLRVVGWRRVPTDPSALGEAARTSAPAIEQLVVQRALNTDAEEAERCAFRARKRLVADPGAYVCSLSFRTVTYKALCAAGQLASFYPDLRDRELAVPFAIFHQRFSTNTEPSWERAQPFRLLCHNGEINTIDGNVNWMRARGSDALEPGGSDSALLDNALELLVRGGRSRRAARGGDAAPRSLGGGSRAT
jgi:glutamate synthase domain-containing protein 1